MKKRLTALVLAALMTLALTVPASAATRQEAAITYRGIYIFVDGVQQAPVDGDGNPV